MELKKLVKSTSYLITANIVQFFSGILKAKISAVYLGAVGLGITSQMMTLTMNMSQLTNMGLGDAMVKQIAEAKRDEDFPNMICASIKSYLVLLLFLVVISSTLFLIFSLQLTQAVFGDEQYLNFYFICIATFPLLILYTVPFALLKSFKDVRAISRAKMLTVSINMIVFIPLVVYWGLEGAVVYVPFFYFLTLVFGYLFAAKYLKLYEISLKRILKTSLNKSFLREMLLFSGIGVFLGGSAIVSDLVCRALMINSLGIEKLGLYSPIITWAGLFSSFILPTFSYYLYPRFCELNSRVRIIGVINDGLRLGTFFLIPLLFLGIPFRELILEIFYSKEFIQVAQYLPLHFIGVAFFTWQYVFIQVMTPTGNIRAHAVFMFIYYFMDVVLTIILVPVFGLFGWMIKYLANPILFFVTYYVFLTFKLKFKIEKANLFLMLYLVLVSFGLIIVTDLLQSNQYLGYLSGIAALLFSIVFLKKAERGILIDRLRIFLRY